MFCTRCGHDVASGTKFCPGCGSPVDNPAQPAAPQQPPAAQSAPPQYTPPAYGAPPPAYGTPPPAYGAPYAAAAPAMAVDPTLKSKMAGGLLGIFLGGFGVHRFYLGYTGIGVIQIIVTLVTCGIGAIWGLIEGILILTGSINKDAQGRPLRE